eukprot:m.73987 g.73987  ORF g.73987 m.73987 type:complete len:431 (+) comp12442_c0_seq2:33-1325(+)
MAPPSSCVLCACIFALFTLLCGAYKAPCKTDDDCSLNGVCTDGFCVCDDGWTTLPFGLNNAPSPGCGYLDFLPSPSSSPCGPACTFHGGEGGIDRNTTSWGGSVNYNPKDGKYWMMAAEMAEGCTLQHWTTNSQVVSAVSDTATGPFVRQSVTVNPWSHNPEAVIAPDGTWIIYTLGNGVPNKGGPVNCKNTSTEKANLSKTQSAPHNVDSKDTWTFNFTVHYASSPEGPWKGLQISIPDFPTNWTMNNWNPAPVIDPKTGSVRVMGHTDWGPWAGETILEAPSWKGPYRAVGGDLMDHCDYCEEDPFMWKDKRGNWHVLYHRMFDPAGPLDPNWGKYDGSWVRPKSPVPSPGWCGGHAFSRDGINWSPWTRCYNTSVTLTNGTTVEFLRRERPKLLIQDGVPTHLYNGVIAPTETYTIVSPLNVPKNRV